MVRMTYQGKPTRWARLLEIEGALKRYSDIRMTARVLVEEGRASLAQYFQDWNLLHHPDYVLIKSMMDRSQSVPDRSRFFYDQSLGKFIRFQETVIPLIREIEDAVYAEAGAPLEATTGFAFNRAHKLSLTDVAAALKMESELEKNPEAYKHVH